MKIAIHYVNDINGKTQSVQLPLSDWEKLLNRLKKYLKIKTDLKEAFDQVAQLRKAKSKKITLDNFLNEL